MTESGTGKDEDTFGFLAILKILRLQLLLKICVIFKGNLDFKEP